MSVDPTPGTTTMTRYAQANLGPITKILQVSTKIPKESSIQRILRQAGVPLPSWININQTMYCTLRSNQMNYCGIMAFDHIQDHLPATPNSSSASTLNFNQNAVYGSFVATGISSCRDPSLFPAVTGSFNSTDHIKRTAFENNKCAVQMHNQTSVPIFIEMFKVTIQGDFSWTCGTAVDDYTHDYPDNYLQNIIGDCYSVKNSGHEGFDVQNADNPDDAYGTGQFAAAAGCHQAWKYGVLPVLASGYMFSRTVHATPSTTDTAGWLNNSNLGMGGVTPACLFARADVNIASLNKDTQNKFVLVGTNATGIRGITAGTYSQYMSRNTIKLVKKWSLAVDQTVTHKFPLRKSGVIINERQNTHHFSSYADGDSDTSGSILPIATTRIVGKRKGQSFYVFRTYGDKVYDSTAANGVTGAASPLVDFKFVKSCCFKVQQTDSINHNSTFQAIPTAVPVADQAHFSYANHTSVGLNHFGDMVAPAMTD